MDIPSVVVVAWFDAVVFAGWVHPDTAEHVPRPIVSVGLLVEDTPDFMILATSFDARQGDDGHFGNLTIIPRRSIDSVTILDDDKEN